MLKSNSRIYDGETSPNNNTTSYGHRALYFQQQGYKIERSQNRVRNKMIRTKGV